MTRLELYELSRRNVYTIFVAACNTGQPMPVTDYDAIGAEIIRMRANPIPAGIQDRKVIPISAPRFQRETGESFLTDQPELI